MRICSEIDTESLPRLPVIFRFAMSSKAPLGQASSRWHCCSHFSTFGILSGSRWIPRIVKCITSIEKKNIPEEYLGVASEEIPNSFVSLEAARCVSKTIALSKRSFPSCQGGVQKHQKLFNNVASPFRHFFTRFS